MERIWFILICGLVLGTVIYQVFFRRITRCGKILEYINYDGATRIKVELVHGRPGEVMYIVIPLGFWLLDEGRTLVGRLVYFSYTPLSIYGYELTESVGVRNAKGEWKPVHKRMYEVSRWRFE